MRYNKFLKTFILIVFVGACPYVLPYNIGVEAAQEGKDVVRENKTITGEVGFINSKFISIIDSRDDNAGSEHEMLIYLDENVDVQRKNSLGEIKAGDTVQIQYEKTTKTLKDVRKSKKVVKGVKFLRAAAKKGKGSTLKSGKK
ncbi:MAG: hypothetical protein KAJ70_05335 [Candidatus Omnitrophica bacterium]|nr:hypothetical protein [Candidatus Omnitrophota bacterium]